MMNSRMLTRMMAMMEMTTIIQGIQQQMVVESDQPAADGPPREHHRVSHLYWKIDHGWKTATVLSEADMCKFHRKLPLSPMMAWVKKLNMIQMKRL